MYNLAKKYSFSLSTDPKQASQAFLLLYELENSVNGAIIQATRINRTRRAIDRKLQDAREYRKDNRKAYPHYRKDFALTKLGCDYHFYFVCIGQFGKLLKRSGEVLNDPDLKSLYTKFERQFDKDIRDHLEHIDERAIGKKREQNIGHISDWGNFVGDGFSFNGKKYPVNKQKLNELGKIYEETIEIMYNNHASKDEDFIMREQTERQTQAILKQLNKQYKLKNI
jgi:hypothetical protein